MDNTRYSEPDGVVTQWDETRRVLETAEVFWLSTVRADGRPHVTPVVAVWHDGAIHFSTADSEQKAVNLRGNPHVILTTGCNHWEEGLDGVMQRDDGPEVDPRGGFTYGGWSSPYFDDFLDKTMAEQQSRPFDFVPGRKTY